MKNIKRLLGGGLAAMMLLSAIACSDSGSNSNNPVKDPSASNGGAGEQTTAGTTSDPHDNDPTNKTEKDLDTSNFAPSGNAGTVRFLGYYDITEDQKGLEQTLIFESEKYNGNIEWISASSGSGYYEKLATLIAADDSPDLMTYEPLAFPYGVKKKMFEALDDHIDIDDPLWDDIRNLIDEYEYEGVHYYVPHRVVTKFSLNYNRKTVDKAGLTDPYDLYVAGEWTWDAWRQMMIEFCNQDDTNIGFYATSTMLEAFINTTGTSLIDVSPDGVISNNIGSADVTRAVEYLAEMGRSGLLYPESHPHGDWVSPQVWAKCSDKILFLGMEPEWTYIAATEEIQNPKGVDNDIHDTVSDFAFVPFPRDPDAGAYYMCSNTFGYMIPKGAKNISGAVEFIYLNRLYETDEAIRAQDKADHISPEKLTYTSGPNEGKQKWQITWDETCYDHWKEMCDSSDNSKFIFVLDDMYGFGDELSVPLTDALYNSTFGVESWSQLSAEIAPVIDGVLAEYA
ncbi:MAG: ABC transporter substrate-binding protein [Oscillospiraceae bacterium]